MKACLATNFYTLIHIGCIIRALVIVSLRGTECRGNLTLSLEGKKGGQASSEDLFPLGYGEWDRTKVRVKNK